jgi:hypothetical protein
MTDQEMTPRRRAEQLVLFAAGIILMASGCLHVLVWLADGGSLEGPVSWRKPILFGVSAGATLLSLGWVVGTMRQRTGDLVLAGALAAAMLVEVGLITLQQWRGVASHFNRATAFDGTVLAWIESLIVLVTFVIAELTRRSFGPLRAALDVALAIRGGMALLLFSCLLGFVLVAWGNHQVAAGRSPEIYGAAGVMKFPHGVPMHAIQFIPILAWLLRKTGAAESRRTRAVAFAIASASAFTAFSLLQTFSGRGRFEFWWLSAAVLVGSVVLLLVPVWVGLAGAFRLLLTRVVHALAAPAVVEFGGSQGAPNNKES